ncbi:MAG TPA: hypothetical protein VJ698_05975, partial [Noviherbaspirillum sp.]|uniref:hypothetical protein n=1 Tax=Noviherbaspirillum sp. TaxID=1926288 RepID=UPI002B496F19
MKIPQPPSPIARDDRQMSNTAMADAPASVIAIQAAETVSSAAPKRPRPAWLTNTLSRRETTDGIKSEIPGVGNRHAALRSKDDQSGADCSIDEFGSSIHQHLAYRWPHDRSVAHDHLGLGTYGDMRRDQLLPISGADYLGDQYGLLTAANVLEQPHGLRTRAVFTSIKGKGTSGAKGCPHGIVKLEVSSWLLPIQRICVGRWSRHA